MQTSRLSHGFGLGYADPVRRLLTLGEVESHDPAGWPDYPAEFELGREHAGTVDSPACDAALNAGDPDNREVWAPCMPGGPWDS